MYAYMVVMIMDSDLWGFRPSAFRSESGDRTDPNFSRNAVHSGRSKQKNRNFTAEGNAWRIDRVD